MNSTLGTKTTEWPALREVTEHRMRLIAERGAQHGQHPITHGSPPYAKETFFASMVMVKAMRIWSNVINGGSRESLKDSLLDISNYADFFSAMLIDEDTATAPLLGDLGKPSERDYYPEPPTFRCVDPSGTKASDAFGRGSGF